jgi:DNA-binding transcriptional regulator GbsR (MarR family)
MASTSPTTTEPAFEGLDPKLVEQLPTFELFFKTFGFKRIHGRVWGLLVLAGVPLTSKEIAKALDISQGATSSCLNELAEWGAIHTAFDSARRSHIHSPIGNTLSIVATVFRRREQVVLGKLRTSVRGTLDYVRERYGEKDPRVLTLRSILSSCEIAEAVMQLVFNSVERALGDSESLLSKALNAAFKVGIGMPARFVTRGNGQEEQEGPLLPGDLSSTQITFEEEEVREEHEELPHA